MRSPAHIQDLLEVHLLLILLGKEFSIEAGIVSLSQRSENKIPTMSKNTEKGVLFIFSENQLLNSLV